AIVHTGGRVGRKNRCKADALGLAIGPQGAETSLHLHTGKLSAAGLSNARPGIRVDRGDIDRGEGFYVFTRGVRDAEMTASGAFAHGDRVAGAVGDVVEAFAELAAENPANPFAIRIVIDDRVSQAERKAVAAVLVGRGHRDFVRRTKQHRDLRHPRWID